MRKNVGTLIGIVLLVLTLLAEPYSVQMISADPGPVGYECVKQAGPQLRLHGRPFRFAGANNYYLMYKSPFMVDDVLQRAAANGFRVLRIWGSLEIGNQDGSNSVHGKADGVYFSYWNGTAPTYNDGADGLEHLDYVVYRAGQLGLKLVIPLVNNWRDFGGMDQYVRWLDGQYHDQFYTDPQIRAWYKAWIAHLLNRTNIYTGLQYKNDPTIMTWELANEPRCKGSGVYPPSGDCTTQTLVDWADDVSHYIKMLDAKHLVSVGDEGFYCIPGAADWTENCGEGVDTLALAGLEQINVMSFHLYPDHWGKDADWGTAWIERHLQDAQELGKPAMLGEYGLQAKGIRNPVYREWTDAVLDGGGAGALYWILSGLEDSGATYPDYDGFTVYCPSPVCTTIGNFAQMMAAGGPLLFAPVADHDTAITEYETALILDPAANDIAYGGATLVPASIDLDPAASGQQTTQSVYGGTFALQPDGTVAFTPDPGFSGQSLASYTIQDSLGQLSNPADLSVTVKPSPTGVLVLFSFETGTEGWAPASWNPTAGTVAQSTDFATDGAYGLQIDTTDGGWFGHIFSPPADLTGKTHLKFDVQTTSVGTGQGVAIQAGDTWEWCQGPWPWIGPGTTTITDLDLLSTSCAAPDLSKIQAIYVWFDGGGTFYMDAVRAE